MFPNMFTKKLITAFFCTTALFSTFSFAQTSTISEADPGDVIGRVWHLGRVTGDLERIIQFYHDLLGLDLRGDRNQAIPFYSVDTINEFVNAPKGAEFRAAFMPIPGTSSAIEPADQIYLEAFEFRDIDRSLIIPELFDLGVSSLRFVVNNIDDIVIAANEAGVSIITAGKEPVSVAAPPGYTGAARAIMLRDSDGYPVELIELSENVDSFAGESSQILGAQMTLVVSSIDDSLDFYRSFLGDELRTWEDQGWQRNEGFTQLRNIPQSEYKNAYLQLPGSAVMLELIEFRNIEQDQYRPVFQDIGFGHMAFMVNDIEEIVSRMNQLGIQTVSESDSWTQINPATRAVYTRDHDGFFIEIIEIQ